MALFKQHREMDEQIKIELADMRIAHDRNPKHLRTFTRTGTQRGSLHRATVVVSLALRLFDTLQ
jgi:hypothetical protein